MARHPEIQRRVDKIEKFLAKARAARDGGGWPLGCSVLVPHPIIIDMMRMIGGFDFFMVNMEHTLINSAELQRLAPVLDLTDAPWLVKVGAPNPDLVVEACDAGAWGVMIPFVEGAEHLQDLINGFKFPPLGTRGICPEARAAGHMTPSVRSGNTPGPHDYIDFVNSSLIIIPNIESSVGIDNIDEILEVEGYDIIHFGWADLNLTLLHQGYDSRTRAAVMKKLAHEVTKKARDAGKLVMTTLPNSTNQQRVQDHLNLFHSDIAFTSDKQALARGLGLSLRMVSDQDVEDAPAELFGLS